MSALKKIEISLRFTKPVVIKGILWGKHAVGQNRRRQLYNNCFIRTNAY